MGDATVHALRLERVARSLASAGKTLRLYPSSSPIPRQSVDAAIEAVRHAFSAGASEITFSVGRDGLLGDGEDPLCVGASSVDDLLSQLREHGISSVTLTPEVTAEELLTLLSTLMLPPGSSPEGLARTLAREGVTHVRVAELQLTVVDATHAPEFADTDEFLRDLASDAGKLAAWFEGAASRDPRSFEESLMELVRVSGPSGFTTLLRSLAEAFTSQTAECKDVLLGLALDEGPTRDLAGGMFAYLSANDIAASVLGGAFGRNMLSLSNALTRLPLDKVTAEVRAEVQALLPSSGHSAKEAAFLDHMLEIRGMGSPEVTLTERDDTYGKVLHAAALTDESVAETCAAVVNSRRQATTAGVRTMLALIGQQADYALCCRGVDSLADMIPALIAQREFELARTVLLEIARRERELSAQWPELTEHVDAALSRATSVATMRALVATIVADPSLLDEARDFLRLSRGAGNDEFVSAAIELKEPGLEVAERLLGGRFEDALCRVALGAPWHLLAPVAAQLGRLGTMQARKTLESLMARPDEQSRREVAVGLGESGGELAVALLGRALSDASIEVVLAATRGLGKSASPVAASIVADRLGRTDIDNDDFDMVVELIGALAQLPGPVADETLARLSSRRGFLKRARHGEIQNLIARARAYRAQTGGGVA